jgi:hypothetical protein
MPDCVDLTLDSEDDPPQAAGGGPSTSNKRRTSPDSDVVIVQQGDQEKRPRYGQPGPPQAADNDGDDVVLLGEVGTTVRVDGWGARVAAAWRACCGSRATPALAAALCPAWASPHATAAGLAAPAREPRSDPGALARRRCCCCCSKLDALNTMRALRPPHRRCGTSPTPGPTAATTPSGSRWPQATPRAVRR